MKINEILIENATVLQDATGEFPAWIELYNPSAEAVDLGGVALSDSLLEPQKWTFPCEAESIIESQGFLLVFLDGRDEIVGGEIHAAFSPQELAEGNFILNRTSDLIVFSAADLETDRSVGRFPDGARAGKLVP
ncbi:MAG: hypothetical protein JXA90_09830, partial [Planctomycetes bacterium]|nr:hypothetical protein [Planctomycetota bacterium]